MPQKPGSMYREVKGQPYTRKEYVGGVPHVLVGQFTMGNRSADFESEVTLIGEERCQIRDAALEAARVTLTRVLTKNLGEENFKAKILVYPHHILRENKQATGAGADRLSEGMRSAFGKEVGNAARVEPNQELIKIWVDEDSVDVAKEALRKASMKLPTPCRKKTED
ncbi:MAG: 50S ribosomal protein L16 [Candidatus Thermoplasmatota archaeon]|nr:50S ribosomal protein L16 [Candidatus Thermoplasmatota archaeon]